MDLGLVFLNPKSQVPNPKSWGYPLNATGAQFRLYLEGLRCSDPLGFSSHGCSGNRTPADAKAQLGISRCPWKNLGLEEFKVSFFVLI